MRHSLRRRRGGFTLMEVLLVLVILVVLASLAVVAYGPIQRKMKAVEGREQRRIFSQRQAAPHQPRKCPG